MDFVQLIDERRSVRDYAAAPTQEDIQKILTMARRAPSWKNMQTSRCYAVTTQDTLERLREAALPSFNQKSSAGAALIVTTFVRDQVGFSQGQPANEPGNMWGAYDLGLHDAYLILSARDMGYDTLIMGLRDEKAIRDALGVPENEQIMSVIAVGKAREEAPLRPRKPLEETARFY